jgi:hypothetical protein
MFNFTTQTVYNNIVVATDAQVKSGAVKNANVITATGTKTPTLRVGNTRFNANQIESIYKRVATPEVLASVTFDMNDIPFETGENEAIARILLYIGLSMNSQDSLYANPFVYKGKPFYVEFKAFNGNAAKTAKECARVVKKFLLFETDEKLLDVVVDGSKVTISGVNGYQQIKKAVLQKFDPEAIKVDCCTDQGEFIDIITGVPAIAETTGTGENATTTYKKVLEDGSHEALDANEVPICPGIEAFGDYNWIIHNLRLPTYTNMNYWSASKEEMPVVGQTYTQFTITMKDKRDRVAGEGVGMRITSVTTHVFYVATPYAALVETALTNLISGTNVTIEEV